MIHKINQFIHIVKDIDFLKEQMVEASGLKNRLRDQELIISVIGQFKRGKSSLINALIGEEILPVGIIPLTTTITEIRHSEDFKSVVYFMDGSKQEVFQEDLPRYVSEELNPNNEKNVEVVKLWTDLRPFDANICIVDTPGVGSTHYHNTESSYDYIEKSDAVLFLLSVDSPVSEAERDFLKKAQKHAVKFYFAVNKIDTVSRENLQEFLNYSKNILSEIIGFSVDMYPTSAGTGEGVSDLKIQLANDLKDSYNEVLEQSIKNKLNELILQSKGKLDLYLKAITMPTEELEEKIKNIQLKQKELDRLSDEVFVLTEAETDRLVDEIEEEMNIMLPNSRKKLKEEAEKIHNKLKNLKSEEYEKNFKSEIYSHLRGKVEELNAEGLTLLEEGYKNITDSLNRKALDIAEYILEMLKEEFQIDYPVVTKKYKLSEREDYFVKINLLHSVNRFIHFLPRSIANKKIYENFLENAIDGLEKNKIRMIYNYRYKMQESLRILYSEFNKDISEMKEELNRLFQLVEKNHDSQKEELDTVERNISLLIEKLNKLESDKI